MFMVLDGTLKGLKGSLKDKENGGWYEALRQDGNFVPGKQCYAHAFVILAATSALDCSIVPAVKKSQIPDLL